MKYTLKIFIPVFAIMSFAFTGTGLKAAITTLNLKCYLEGFYNPDANQMTKPVPVTVTLVGFPDSFSSNTFIDINGNATVNIDIPSSNNYYIKVTNWNMVETWSQNLFPFTIGGTTDVDLTLLAESTFGNNAKLIDILPIRYGIFAGDISQDSYVDLTDLVLADEDCYNYASGNLVTDITGDELIDIDDLLILENNSNDFIGTVRP